MLRPSPPPLAIDPRHPFVSFIAMHFSLWRMKVSEYRLMVAIAEERTISEKCHYQNITNIHTASICVKQDLLPQSNSVYCVWRKKSLSMQIVSLFVSTFYSIFLYICTHMHFPFEFPHILEDIKKKNRRRSTFRRKSETLDANAATTSHS